MKAIQQTSIVLLKVVAYFLICYAYLSLTSCYTKKGCIEKFVTHDTIEVVHRDTIQVILPADTIHLQMDIDSLQKMLNDARDLFWSDDVVLLSDSQYVLKASYDKPTNKIKFKVIEKEGKQIRVPYEVQIKVPCNQKVWTKLDHARAIKWPLFVVFMLGICLGIYIQLRNG
jgi:hypothetical protein